MSEAERIARQLERSIAGPAWAGPSVLEALSEVTATQACAYPVPNAHSIWEITHHLKAWQEVARLRLDGVVWEPTPEENFPAPEDPSAEAWEQLKSALLQDTQQLHARILAMDDADFHAPVADRDYDTYTLLHGVVQHNLYHAGQIALLKKYA